MIGDALKSRVNQRVSVIGMLTVTFCFIQFKILLFPAPASLKNLVSFLPKSGTLVIQSIFKLLYNWFIIHIYVYEI